MRATATRRVRGGVTIRPVRTRSDLREFIRLPFRLYTHDRNWVAPLVSELRKQLDPRDNPFFEHAEAGLFLARRDGRTVGRISAHVDERYNEFHAHGGTPDTTGFWGFLESEDDPTSAAALLDAAGAWLAERGRTVMVGPASFTLNDEAGLLVDGFELSPVILMAYNPPWYAPLVEGAGLAPIQDLYAYRLDTSAEAPREVVEEARATEGRFTVRGIRMREFEAELLRFLTVYNEAWERNWGFCPLTEAEIRAHAKLLRPLLDPNLVFMVEEAGQPVAAGLTLPDVNEALIHARGHLRPAAAARLLWKARRRRWNVCRVFALGVRRDWRRTGVGARLYVETLAAAKRGGYRWGEMSWILESNTEMNRAIRRMGGEVYKTYRMYSRDLS